MSGVVMREAVLPLVRADETTDADSFVAGRVLRLPSGEVVRFADNAWRVPRSAPKTGTELISFERLPQWLTRGAKLCVAEGWLEEARSAQWMRLAVAAFQLIAEALPAFDGSSPAELTADHSRLVRRHLEDQVAAAVAALERAEEAAGRPLSKRERKRVVQESGGRLHVSQVTTYFARLTDALERHDGVIVVCPMQAPPDGTEARGPGSAAAVNVVDPETQAALLTAVDAELAKYESARALIEEAFEGVNWALVQGKEMDPTPMIEMYLGRNGRPVWGVRRITAAIGWAPSSAPSVMRTIKRFLQERVSPEARCRLYELREHLARSRGENAADRLELDALLSGIDLAWREPNRRVIELFFGIEGERMHSQHEIGSIMGVASARGANFRIKRWLPLLLGRERARAVMDARKKAPFLLARAIKAQAVKLQLCVARRVGALVEIEAEPKIETHDLPNGRVSVIHFRSWKMWGEEGAPDPVPCPHLYGDLAREAIADAQRLTRDLRKAVDGTDVARRLFIVPDGDTVGRPVPLSEKTLLEYVYVTQPGKDRGLLRRYAIPGGDGFQLHNIRHTMATAQVAAGGDVGQVADYLGHNVSSHLKQTPLTAHTFYVAGMHPSVRRAAVRAIASGAADGERFNAIARVMIEEMNEEARQLDVPATQLSFDEALERIRTSDIVQALAFTADDAREMLKGGVFVSVTRYGGCLLPLDEGPCPAAHACPIGPEPEKAREGKGCAWHVRMPHAVEQLENDLAVMRAEYEALGEEYEVHRNHLHAQIKIWEEELQRAMRLAMKMATMEETQPLVQIQRRHS